MVSNLIVRFFLKLLFMGAKEFLGLAIRKKNADRICNYTYSAFLIIRHRSHFTSESNSCIVGKVTSSNIK